MSSCHSDFWYLDWFWSYGRKTEPLCRNFPIFGMFFDPPDPLRQKLKNLAWQTLTTTVSEVSRKFGWNRLARFREFLLKIRINRRISKAHAPWRGLITYLNHVSQLNGNTIVVIASNGLHRKCQSLTPCQRHPSQPIENLFGMIDYVIKLNYRPKFGFEIISRDGK